MSSKKTFIFLAFIFLMVAEVFSQTTRVIVVPFTRFQLVSDFSLEEIAEINDINSSEVYSTYVNELQNTFSQSSTEQVSFNPISPQKYAEIKKYIQYQLDKFKGRNYNATNLSLLSNDLFKSVLFEENATHIMFLNWYTISKSIHTAYVGDRNKRQKFSTHAMDYDVYDQNKNRVLGKSKAELWCGDFPNASMIKNKSLKASELSVCYSKFINELIEDLLQP